MFTKSNNHILNTGCVLGLYRVDFSSVNKAERFTLSLMASAVSAILVMQAFILFSRVSSCFFRVNVSTCLSDLFF